MNWNELITSGELNGYEPGSPGEWADIIDAEVVADSRCSECGGALTYHPMISGNSYRAFAVCSECDNAEEF